MNAKRNIGQILLYFIVGLVATFAEWGVFYVLDICLGWHYILATTAAFSISTFVNWLAGRMLLFKNGDPKGIIHELISIYAISCIGLLCNFAILWVSIDCLGVNDMLSKVLATGMVFFGNFAIRKYWLYRV